MELDEDTKAELSSNVMPIITSAIATACVAAASAALLMMIGTNMRSSDLTGEKEIHPTENGTSISKVETSANNTDASLAKDEVKAQGGDLSAAQTDAAASSGEATAVESGATAARTKAGAADIETKALKMT